MATLLMFIKILLFSKNAEKIMCFIGTTALVIPQFSLTKEV